LARHIQRRIWHAHIGVRSDTIMADQYSGDLLAYCGNRD
jgi:hypothetical protein